ncbi:MAG: lysine--tRNA ligase [Marivibrio sp.]|uniref:lysine--tRNA ligase n=1 Tax=Marivibrio sp. TaxID=2039719 RepID=UPI0032ED220A
MSTLRDMALEAKAWPFEEARKILKRYEKTPPEKGYVLFETGYGPSGLPHIGTFGEVLRTTMVRRAFELMSDIPTKLLAFSDDMDGLRKVPDNVPNKEQLQAALNKRLTKVPDPFGTHESFGHHNNARLRAFLDGFGFEYEFASSTDYYFSGRFDEALIRVLEEYEAIQKIMLPSLRDERKATYSPFLPVDPETDEVYQVPVIATDAKKGTIVYRRADGEEIETPVTGGRCKLQWKPDWGMRWHALGVDYEMSGKDLIDSVRLSSRICQALGGWTPETLTYELFLDDKGEKISKSKGNGLSMDDWLAYGPNESLALFMFQKPKTAKKLYFDVIPKTVDDYLTFLSKFDEEPAEKRLENPVWHIHEGAPPAEKPKLNFSILLNLAAVCNSEDKSVLWGFITRYAPDASPQHDPTLDRLVGHAIRYYQDFVKPHKAYKAPDARDRAALEDLRESLAALPADADAETIQTEIYEIGKRHGYEPLRDWFKALYQILLGQDQGPRIGSFFALYGLNETIALIDRALRGEDLSAA